MIKSIRLNTFIILSITTLISFNILGMEPKSKEPSQEEKQKVHRKNSPKKRQESTPTVSNVDQESIGGMLENLIASIAYRLSEIEKNINKLAPSKITESIQELNQIAAQITELISQINESTITPEQRNQLHARLNELSNQNKGLQTRLGQFNSTDSSKHNSEQSIPTTSQVNSTSTTTVEPEKVHNSTTSNGQNLQGNGFQQDLDIINNLISSLAHTQNEIEQAIHNLENSNSTNLSNDVQQLTADLLKAASQIAELVEEADNMDLDPFSKKNGQMFEKLNVLFEQNGTLHSRLDQIVDNPKIKSKSITTTQTTPQPQIEQPENCVICLEPLTNDSRIALLPCGHSNICRNCARTNFFPENFIDQQENSRNLCPLCRTPVDKDDLQNRLDQKASVQSTLPIQQTNTTTQDSHNPSESNRSTTQPIVDPTLSPILRTPPMTTTLTTSNRTTTNIDLSDSEDDEHLQQQSDFVTIHIRLSALENRHKKIVNDFHNLQNSHSANDIQHVQTLSRLRRLSDECCEAQDENSEIENQIETTDLTDLTNEGRIPLRARLDRLTELNRRVRFENIHPLIELKERERRERIEQERQAQQRKKEQEEKERKEEAQQKQERKDKEEKERSEREEQERITRERQKRLEKERSQPSIHPNVTTTTTTTSIIPDSNSSDSESDSSSSYSEDEPLIPTTHIDHSEKIKESELQSLPKTDLKGKQKEKEHEIIVPENNEQEPGQVIQGWLQLPELNTLNQDLKNAFIIEAPAIFDPTQSWIEQHPGIIEKLNGHENLINRLMLQVWAHNILKQRTVARHAINGIGELLNDQRNGLSNNQRQTFIQNLMSIEGMDGRPVPEIVASLMLLEPQSPINLIADNILMHTAQLSNMIAQVTQQDRQIIPKALNDIMHEQLNEVFEGLTVIFLRATLNGMNLDETIQNNVIVWSLEHYRETTAAKNALLPILRIDKLSLMIGRMRPIRPDLNNGQTSSVERPTINTHTVEAQTEPEAPHTNVVQQQQQQQQQPPQPHQTWKEWGKSIFNRILHKK